MLDDPLCLVVLAVYVRDLRMGNNLKHRDDLQADTLTGYVRSAHRALSHYHNNRHIDILDPHNSGKFCAWRKTTIGPRSGKLLLSLPVKTCSWRLSNPEWNWILMPTRPLLDSAYVLVMQANKSLSESIPPKDNSQIFRSWISWIGRAWTFLPKLHQGAEVRMALLRSWRWIRLTISRSCLSQLTFQKFVDDWYSFKFTISPSLDLGMTASNALCS